MGKRQQKALDTTLHKVLDIYNENHPADGDHQDTILLGTIVHKKCCKESVVNRGKKICQLDKKERLVFRDRMLLMGRPKPKKIPPRPVRLIHNMDFQLYLFA